MQLQANKVLLSATDLANHLGCNHLTWLNKRLAEGELEVSYRGDPVLDLLIERGLLHEQAYVEYLVDQGKTVAEIREFSGDTGIAETIKAIKAGVDVITQASLVHDNWAGRADFLIKVKHPSDLGDWYYEVADTKLSQNTRAGTILQLCLYSELVSHIQGVMPEFTYVVKPGEPFDTERFRVNDFLSYYRLVKNQLEQAISSNELADSYPNPVDQCEICRWWNRCNDIRRADDHLSFIAGISKSQISELNRQGIHSLESFASAIKPLNERPERGSAST